MYPHKTVFFVWAAFLLLAGACTLAPASPTASPMPTETPIATTPAPIPSPTPEPVVTITPTPTPTETPTPLPTSTATPDLSALRLQSTPMQGEAVFELQLSLLSLGYAEAGPPDGVFDAQTEAALMHFQFLNGLPVSGVVDEQTREALAAPAPVVYRPPRPFPGRELRQNPAEPLCDDRALQERLAELQYLVPGGEEWDEAIYGSRTAGAVTAFQIVNGMEPTGVVDLVTWRALFSPWAIPGEQANPIVRPSRAGWKTSLYPVERAPVVAMAFDGRRVWVAFSSGPEPYENWVIGIDPAADPLDVIAPIMVGDCQAVDSTLGGMVFAGGKLHLLFPNAAESAQPVLRSLDPDTGILGDPVEVGECPEGFCFPSSALGFDGQRIWASAGSRVWPFTPTGDSLPGSVEAGWLAAGSMVYDGQCLWMRGEAGATLFHPAGGLCRGSDIAYALPSGPLAFDGQRIWASDGEGMLVSLDLATGQLGQPIMVGSLPVALAFDGHRLWVASADENTVQPVDVDTGELGEAIPVGERPEALLFDGMRLWVVNSWSGTVQYIQVLGQ